MKVKGLLIVLLGLLPAVLFGQVISNFDEAPADSNYWKWVDYVNEAGTSGIGGHYTISGSADTDSGRIDIEYVSEPVFEGTGALKIDYRVHNAESWGGFTKIEHWHPDSTQVYDFSVYDSISVRYYVTEAASQADIMVFRLNLHDVSNSENGANTYTNTQAEYYYSFHEILDSEPGWNEIKMPLIADNNYWEGQGFNLTGWAGIAGNGTLDKDKIKGFTFEFSHGGTGAGDVVSGSIIFDQFILTGAKAVPFVFFNGKSIPSNISASGWGQSTIEVEEGTAEDGSNVLKWVQGDEWANGWSGISFDASAPLNMSAAWAVDSIKLKMKAMEGLAPIRLQLENGTDKIGKVFQPETDGVWHDYAFKLSELDYMDGSTKFDSSIVSVLVFMAEGNSVVGNTIYMDNVWTGSPSIDVVAPDSPASVDGIAMEYYNLVIWEDVPGETGEVYDVYASTEPIIDVTDPGVDVVKLGVLEDEQSVAHWIYYPLVDTDVEYHYAIVCKDAAGNESETIATTSVAVSNTAKGIATISMNPPADFGADGDLSEWYASGIIPFELTPENYFVSTGTVDSPNDITATVFLAIDQDNLYIAADIIDDVYFYGEGDWWLQDVLEIFMGLYNRESAKHSAIERGAEPDYKFVMSEVNLNEDYSVKELGKAGDENYYFSDFGGSDYVVEAKVSLDSLTKTGDDRFVPVRGMRIPLEITLHDNDGSGHEGNLTTSASNTDNAHQTPSVWFETWIGDTTHVVTAIDSDLEAKTVANYKLAQNYPNPFNPTTKISYTLAKSGLVEIDVYNSIGQKVRTLVNKHQNAGNYEYDFNASDLSSGIYFCKLQSGSFNKTIKMVLMK